MLALSITLSAAAPTDPESKPEDAGTLLVQALQTDIQRQQQEIDKIAAANVVAAHLITDMAIAGMKDDAIMDLLNRNGFAVKGSSKKADSIPPNQAPAVARPEPIAITVDTGELKLSRATQESIDKLRTQWKANAKKIEVGANVVSKLEMFETLLLDLSKTDPAAQALVDKYHLHRKDTTPP